MSSSGPATAPSPRLQSLDVLRGFDMIWILHFEGIFHALARITDARFAELLDGQLKHSAWAGLTFYDLIFPLFVFITGVSSVFSITRQLAQHGRGAAIRRILRRGLLLFVLGIFYNGGVTAAWPDVRLLGVLQRLALVYVASGMLFCFFKPRVLGAVAAGLLLGYWALIALVPIRDVQLEPAALATRLAPVSSPEPTPVRANGTSGKSRRSVPEMARVRMLFYETTTQVSDHYERGLNLPNHFDFEYLPGKLSHTYFDAEGILSTFPAIATGLIGVMTGILLLRFDLGDFKKIAWMAGTGAGLLVIGFWWGFEFPIIKRLWTSSFVLVTAGWSLLLLAAFYYAIDVRKWRQWCRPFLWIGMNPIALYVTAGAVGFDRIAQRLVGGDVHDFLDRRIAPGWGDLVQQAAIVGLIVLVARFLYRREIFLKV